MLKSLIQNVLKNTLFLFFLRHLNHARNLMQKLDWRTKIHFWLEWKIANFYADAGKRTRFYNVQDIKRGTWRVSPRCRRRETHEQLWIRNLPSTETKFAPYETNSNLYRERFAEQTKLPTMYIPTYIRRGVVDRANPQVKFFLDFSSNFSNCLAIIRVFWFSQFKSRFAALVILSNIILILI